MHALIIHLSGITVRRYGPELIEILLLPLSSELSWEIFSGNVHLEIACFAKISFGRDLGHTQNNVRNDG